MNASNLLYLLTFKRSTNASQIADISCSGERLSLDPTDRPSLFSTSCTKTLDRIAWWMETCSIWHNSCNAVVHNGFLPTRLLEVTSGESFRLVDSSLLPHDARYMTISHCWGPDSPGFTLSQTSFGRLKTGCPIDRLPQTFRDAVHIVKHFGCPYLWIDALCIIQGDKADWRRESSKMADVYLNSELNIAASVGINSHQGIFKHRNPLKISPCIIRTSWTTASKVIASHRNYDDLAIEDFHLNTRAWVLQERLLAPRVVHFGPKEVHWECNSSLCRETFPQQELRHAGDANMKGCLAIGGSLRGDLDDPDTLLKAWAYIVRLYTATNLTYLSDKLAAISALARRFDTVSKGTLGRYFAGLWEVDFIHQLGWRTDSPQNPPLPDYVAPSWSWASVQEPVYGATQVRESNRDLVHLEPVHTSAIFDPFGPVNDEHIRLKGILVKLLIAVDSYKAVELVYVSGESFAIKDHSVVGYASVDRYPPFPEFSHGEQAECFLLPLFETNLDGDSNNPPLEELVGLVLRPTAAKEGQFNRIGIIVIAGPKARDAYERAVPKQIIEDRFFKERDERWGYLIEII